MAATKKLLSVVGAMSIAILLVACGSGSSNSGSSTGSTSAGHAPIKVGVICSCSGGAGLGATIMPGEQLYKAWANTVNASGGISGHPIQLVTDDDGTNPSTGLSDARTLVSDHVVAVADLSVVDQAFAPVLQAANIPVVGVITYETPFGTNPDFFPEAQTNDSAIYAVLKTAKAAGATNLANVYCAEAPVCAQSVPAFKETGTKLGVPVPYNAEISATAPSYTAQCLAAEQQHVKSVFIGEPEPLVIRVAGDCTGQNYNPIYVTEGSGFGMNMASAPGLKQGLWTEFPALPFFASGPQVQAANAAMDKYYPGVRTNGSIFLEQDFLAWTSGMLLEDALKGGGLTPSAAPTAAEVLKGLYSLKGDTLGGLTSALTFSPGKPNTVDCWFTTRIENGTPTLLDNGQTSCQPSS